MTNIVLKSVTLYPFRAEHIPFVVNLSYFKKDLYVNSVISVKGSGLEGHDIGFSDNIPNQNINVEDNIINSIKKSDVLLILPEIQPLAKKSAYTLIKKAINFKKNIICLMTLSNSQKKYILQKSKENGTEFVYAVEKKEVFLEADTNKPLHTPISPIIFVGGLLEEADQFGIVTNLAKLSLEHGYKPSVLCNNCLGEFLGFYNYNKIINSNFSEPQKIKMINAIINQIEIDEHPDIFFVQLPGTMMRLNEFLPNDFGIYTTMFAEAVIPDYVICSAMCGMYDANSFIQLSTYFEKRFGFKIDCVNLTNKLLNGPASLEAKKPRFIKISPNRYENEIKKIKNKSTIPVYNFTNKSENQEFFNLMIKTLMNN